MVTLNLDRIFDPKSIAIIEASDEPSSVVYALMKNFVDLNFEGKVYPVNLRKTEIFGLEAYSSVERIHDPVDLAIIVTPSQTVPQVLEQCGKAGIRGIIMSAGFKEIGPEGQALEKEIAETSKKYAMRIVGPNCLGVIRPGICLNATFMNKMPRALLDGFRSSTMYCGRLSARSPALQP